MKRKGVIGELLGVLIGPFVILLAAAAVPFDDQERRHLTIDWQTDFAKAQEIAQRANKPILAFTVAGELKGRC